MRGHRIHDVGDGDDARADTYLPPDQTLRVTAAVETFMVVQDDVGDIGGQICVADHVVAKPAVRLDDFELGC